VTLAVYVLFLHFLGDFVFQTSWMATEKSHDWMALFDHYFEYLVVLISGLFLAYLLKADLTATGIILFAGANAAVHWCVDAVTSRLNAFFKRCQPLPWAIKGFWVCIGFDQFIHVALLIVTLPVLKWL
jgi:uncharacterized membrane protein